MRKLLFTLFIFIYLSIGNVEAQYKDAPNGITAKRVLMDFYTVPNNKLATWEDLRKLGGVELGFNHHLNNYLNLAIPLRLGAAKVPLEGGGFSKELINAGIDATIQLKYFKPKKFIAPYLLAGIGMYSEDWNNPRADIPLGIGLNFRLGPLVYLNLQTEYRLSLKKNRDNLAHSLGILVLLGNEKKDKDKDGIADDMDDCPDVAGLAEFKGCPDADADGVPEPKDACPGVPGLVSLNGCPDKDNDGIQDDKDKCPDVAGLKEFDGCPDSDGDGIPEPGDDCPGVKGTKALNGCPDRDGDGITDKDDKCPDQAGTKALKGCPDRDNDGIIDSEDKCPDQAGPLSNKGCPEMKKEEKAKLENAARSIQFEYGSSIIKKESYPILDDVAKLMNTYSAYSCDIAGHTDNSGDDSFNLMLSEKRAKSCLDYLTSKGINASRMTSKGFGETKPVADNKTAEGRKLNRRVEFLMTVK